MKSPFSRHLKQITPRFDEDSCSIGFCRESKQESENAVLYSPFSGVLHLQSLLGHLWKRNTNFSPSYRARLLRFFTSSFRQQFVLQQNRNDYWYQLLIYSFLYRPTLCTPFLLPSSRRPDVLGLTLRPQSSSPPLHAAIHLENHRHTDIRYLPPRPDSSFPATWCGQRQWAGTLQSTARITPSSPRCGGRYFGSHSPILDSGFTPLEDPSRK